ncbi:putative aldo/keto reductase [Zopfochytrium polystomum]|nr:putative aldo/keto reductase [Zopfochytrium polystomum]
MASSSSSTLPPMEYRHLGRSGLKVSVLSLGGWLTYGGQVDDTVTEACLKAAYDAGINFFDNAESYGNGESELAMGRVIKKLAWPRPSFVVSTKIYFGSKSSPLVVGQPEPGSNSRGLSRKHLVEGVKAALDRLQLEYVDLVFAHRPDDDTPMEEVVRGFNWVIEKGWAFYWGTSEWSAEQITDAHRIAERLGLIGPLMEQPQYNMFHRERFEKEYHNLYAKYGLGTTIWSPLASGILTGKYNDAIPDDSRLRQAANLNVYIKKLGESLATEDGIAKISKVKALAPIAAKLECTLAQLALAWTIKNPHVSTAITGASRPAQVLENVRALAVVPLLTDTVVKEIDEILANKPQLPPSRF